MNTYARNAFYLLFAVLLSCGTPTEKQPEGNTPAPETVFYFVRHAEKDRSNPENRNPELTEKGRNRAEFWSKTLAEIPLAAVYSTNYHRTIQTAQPSADARKLDVSLYEHDSTIVHSWMEKHRGEHIMVVGHSNTIPVLVNALLGEYRYPQIEDSNNANLYIVTSNGKTARSILLQPDF